MAGRATVAASLSVGAAPRVEPPAKPAARPRSRRVRPAPLTVTMTEPADEDDGEPHCTGPLDDHCCWLEGGVVCRYLVVGETRVWCGLLLELGAWEKVYADPRWVKHVKPTFDRHHPGFGCGDYPQNIPATRGQCCWRGR